MQRGVTTSGGPCVRGPMMPRQCSFAALGGLEHLTRARCLCGPCPLPPHLHPIWSPSTVFVYSLTSTSQPAMGREVCDVALGPGACILFFFFCSCVTNLVYPPHLLHCSALGAPMLLLTLTASFSLGVLCIGKKMKYPIGFFFSKFCVRLETSRLPSPLCSAQHPSHSFRHSCCSSHHPSCHSRCSSCCSRCSVPPTSAPTPAPISILSGLCTPAALSLLHAVSTGKKTNYPAGFFLLFGFRV